MSVRAGQRVYTAVFVRSGWSDMKQVENKVPGATVRVWDLPLRLFHWALVLLVASSIYTGLTGGFNVMDYHKLSGYGILTLLLFRLAWGFYGSRYSRFASFPAWLPLSWRDSRRGWLATTFPTQGASVGHASPGHSRKGALSILAMLLALTVQGVTGLFANDDILVEGPLAGLVSDDTSNLLTRIHHYNLWLVYLLVALHIAAVAFYELFKREALLLPMITGYKQSDLSAATQEEQPARLKEGVLGLVLVALAAGLVYCLIALSG